MTSRQSRGGENKIRTGRYVHGFVPRQHMKAPGRATKFGGIVAATTAVWPQQSWRSPGGANDEPRLGFRRTKAPFTPTRRIYARSCNLAQTKAEAATIGYRIHTHIRLLNYSGAPVLRTHVQGFFCQFTTSFSVLLPPPRRFEQENMRLLILISTSAGVRFLCAPAGQPFVRLQLEVGT